MSHLSTSVLAEESPNRVSDLKSDSGETAISEHCLHELSLSAAVDHTCNASVSSLASDMEALQLRSKQGGDMDLVSRTAQVEHHTLSRIPHFDC